MLINNGANVSIVNKDGDSQLSFAAAEGKLKTEMANGHILSGRPSRIFCSIGRPDTLVRLRSLIEDFSIAEQK